MKKSLIILILSIIPIMHTFALGEGDRLDLAITPIRMDIEAPRGNNTAGTVTLYNNSDLPYSFYMSAENCTVTTDYKSPICTGISGTPGIQPNSLATWIQFDTTATFTLAPKTNRVMNYTIRTPSNAIPGGHYGAIFFNSPSNPGNASISMNRRIGSLLLVTVPGAITVDPEFGAIQVVTQGAGGYSSGTTSGTDFFDFSGTGSVIDKVQEKGKKFLMVFSDPELQEDIFDFFNPLWSAPELDPNITFKTEIGLPVNNKGTIHIVPEGTVTLHERDGTQLKNIGKEYIKNENGAVVGERIVDYLTINEGDGNVLPNTSRIFLMTWLGFARESYGAGGKIEVNYETPGSYYSRMTRDAAGFLNPWEKLAIKHTNKELSAHVNLSYINPITQEKLASNSIVPIQVDYDEVVKTWNSGAIILTTLFAFILWFFFRRRKKEKAIVTSSRPAAITQDEIEVLEQARAVMFAKEAARAAREQATILARKKKASETAATKAPVKRTPRKPTVKKPTDE